ncbi:MAG: hypothetical protein JKY55_18680 [Aliivibrio sp.]|uniref:hypothetical protein n=1 Tax=Aliivibrio sp. TaxID=1872443 RepID=UPI001A540BC9|nr:hypothetical protein [Aliivibrio sp.]
MGTFAAYEYTGLKWEFIAHSKREPIFFAEWFFGSHWPDGYGNKKLKVMEHCGKMLLLSARLIAEEYERIFKRWRLSGTEFDTLDTYYRRYHEYVKSGSFGVFFSKQRTAEGGKQLKNAYDMHETMRAMAEAVDSSEDLVKGS